LINNIAKGPASLINMIHNSIEELDEQAIIEISFTSSSDYER